VVWREGGAIGGAVGDGNGKGQEGKRYSKSSDVRTKKSYGRYLRFPWLFLADLAVAGGKRGVVVGGIAAGDCVVFLMASSAVGSGMEAANPCW